MWLDRSVAGLMVGLLNVDIVGDDDGRSNRCRLLVVICLATMNVFHFEDDLAAAIL